MLRPHAYVRRGGQLNVSGSTRHFSWRQTTMFSDRFETETFRALKSKKEQLTRSCGEEKRKALCHLSITPEEAINTNRVAKLFTIFELSRHNVCILSLPFLLARHKTGIVSRLIQHRPQFLLQKATSMKS